MNVTKQQLDQKIEQLERQRDHMLAEAQIIDLQIKGLKEESKKRKED